MPQSKLQSLVFSSGISQIFEKFKFVSLKNSCYVDSSKAKIIIEGDKAILQDTCLSKREREFIIEVLTNFYDYVDIEVLN